MLLWEKVILMADAIKWAILATLLFAIIVLFVGFIDEIALIPGIGTAVQVIATGLSVVTPYLTTARELLNCFVVPQLLTVCLYIYFFGFIFHLTVKLYSLVVRFIYK